MLMFVKIYLGCWITVYSWLPEANLLKAFIPIMNFLCFHCAKCTKCLSIDLIKVIP